MMMMMMMMMRRSDRSDRIGTIILYKYYSDAVIADARMMNRHMLRGHRRRPISGVSRNPLRERERDEREGREGERGRERETIFRARFLVPLFFGDFALNFGA